MTEVEKMRSSQLADMSAPELQVRFEHAKKLLAIMRGLSTYDDGYRELLEELVPGIPETSVICPPFHCDHGDGIKLGEHVFVNANCTFLDGGYITIGAHTLVGPCVQIYTPHHPMNYLERRGSKDQVFCITHLPQTASIAKQHYHLAKIEQDDRTVSTLSVLNEDERVTQIASMMSGRGMSSTALAAAKELIDHFN